MSTLRRLLHHVTKDAFDLPATWNYGVSLVHGRGELQRDLGQNDIEAAEQVRNLDARINEDVFNSRSPIKATREVRTTSLSASPFVGARTRDTVRNGTCARASTQKSLLSSTTVRMRN